MSLEDNSIETNNPMEAKCVRRWRHRGNAGYVSPLYRCPTEQATDLCFHDISDKLKNSGNYDIGGTYKEDQSDFWFYYTTTMSHGYNFLLSLFVLPRNPGCFTLTIPKWNQISSQIMTNDVKLAITYGPETQLTFTTSQKDEHVYIKTYLFNSDDVSTLENCMLLMPMTIQVHTKIKLDQEVVRRIKLAHNLNSLMTDKESADLFIESNTKKKYPVHKLLLAAHSPILRSMLRRSDKVLSLDISDDAIEIMLEFLYTGTLENLYKKNCLTLLDTAEKLELKQLFSLAQQLLKDEINIQNAFEIALQAKKYKLESLTYKVFHFIKSNPEVLTTEGWQNLQDVQLIKQLLKYIHPSSITDSTRDS